MKRLVNTDKLEIGETIILLQDKKAYEYIVYDFVNDINLHLKNEKDIFLNISLTRDGFFTTLEEYKKVGIK